MCMSLLIVFATNAEDSQTTVEELSELSDGSVVLTVSDITPYRTVERFEAPPTPEGYDDYIFSGWYTDKTCTMKTALAATVTSETVGENTLAYAKFVPKEVLGVRAQVTAATEYKSDTANIRFVTSVDSANYQAVGFDCEQNGKIMNGESKSAYKKLQFMNNEGKIMNYSPGNVFHAMSKYFMAATLQNVVNADFGDGITVTPYWITLDGTKVSGEPVTKTVNMAYLSSMNGVTATKQFSFSRMSGLTNYALQGGCTDGTYYYEALSNSNEDDEPDTGTVYIRKYNMQSGDLEGTSKDLNLHHANDITYNPDLKYGTQKGLLVVVHAKPAGTRLSFVNPSDLKIVSPSDITDSEGNAIQWAWTKTKSTEGDEYLDFTTTEQITTGFFSLDYNSTYKKYVVGILGGQKFTFLDAKLAETGTIFSPTGESKGFTTQGNTCDDGYVYFVLHHDTDTEDGKKYETHIITVYDWFGNFVTVLQIPTSSIPIPISGEDGGEEPENISIHNNTMYISVNVDTTLWNTSSNAVLYKVNGVTYAPTSTVATIERDGVTEEYVSLEDAMMDAEADETITIVAETVEVGSQMEMLAENVTLTNEAGRDVTITRKSNYTGALINNSAKNFTIKSNTTGSLSFDGTGTSKGASWIVNGADGELNIKNVTVQNVNMNKDGGAVNAKSGTVMIEECIFDKNTNTKAGGAIYSTASVTIEDTVFQSNSASNGGAICNYTNTVTIIDCTFGGVGVGNTATNGGAIYCGASGTINLVGTDKAKAVFIENKATGTDTINNFGGGAICIGKGILNVDNYIFQGNTAFRGGALALRGSMTTQISNSEFVENHAETEYGGAIHNLSTTLTISNDTLFSDNAAVEGGAIYTLAQTDVEDGTFTSNTATGQGGAIKVSGTTLTIKTTTFGGSTYIDGEGNEVNLGNVAGTSGGAIYGASNSTITVGTENGEKETTEIFENNRAEGEDGTGVYGGGAICVGTGTLSVYGYQFIGNSSAYLGGAITHNQNDGQLNICQSVFESNTSTKVGGAIYNRAALDIDSCEFNQNESTTNNGGAISISGITTEEGKAIVKNSTFDGNKATANATDCGEGSSINMPGGTWLILENCQFTNGETRADDTYSNCGYGDVRLGNNSSAGGLKISGEMVCDVYFNKAGKLIVSDSLTEESQVVANWKNNAVTGDSFEGISYASEDVMSASQECILLSDNYNKTYVIKNVGTTGTLVKPIEVTNETELASAIGAIGEMDDKIGFIKVTEDFTISATVTIPADVNMTILDDGTARTITRAEGAKNKALFTVTSGGTFALGSTSKTNSNPTLTIDGGSANGIINDTAASQLINNYGDVKVGKGVKLTNNICSANAQGYGIYAQQNSTTIFSGVVSNIEGQYSVARASVFIIKGTFTLKDAIVSNNKALGGGVIRVDGGQLTAINTVFDNNDSSANGGAIILDKKTTHTLSFDNCTFIDNDATGYGGAIYVSQNIKINITKCTFTNNTAGKDGGAIYMSNGTLTYTDCTFSGNTATEGDDDDIYITQ